MKTNNAPAYLSQTGRRPTIAFGGAQISLIATREQTGELIEVVEVLTPVDFKLPPHRHTKTHKSFYVIAGEVLLSFSDKTYHLKAGDFGHIPTNFAHQIESKIAGTNLLYFTGAGGLTSLFTALSEQEKSGKEVQFSFPDTIDFQLATDFVPAPTTESATNLERPDGIKPYVIAKGGGENLIVEDQLQTFLVRQNNTGGQYLIVLTQGPKGNAIIQHYHKLHTECFYALEGEMSMWNEGQVTSLKPGDFLHVPAFTKHSYRLDSPYTKFIGMLSPGIFEPFFDALCTPYPENTLPEKPGPARIDRVLKNYGNLDLFFVSPPPDKSMNPIQGTMVRFSFWLAGKLASKK